jgi:hypothetical protein
MSRVETIEKQIEALSAEDLGNLRRWFQEFGAAAWDRQLEQDARTGKLDSLADEAVRDHRGGKSTEF